MTRPEPVRFGIRPTTLPLMPRYASAARKLVSRRQAAEPCQEMTVDRRPCRSRRLVFGRTCSSHLDREARAVADNRRNRAEAIVERWWASLTPACADWRVTDADLAAARTVMADHADEWDRHAHAVTLMWRWQQGRCGVCGFGAEGWLYPGEDFVRWSSHDFVLDHCHRTALMRGYLCVTCNIGEGVGDHGAFALYRTRPPAVILGLEVRYRSDVLGWAEPEAESPTALDRDPAYLVAAALSRDDDEGRLDALREQRQAGEG